MADVLADSWEPWVLRAGRDAPAANPLRRMFLSQQDLRNAVCTPWRVATRTVLNGGGGNPQALAAAAGFTLAGDSIAAVAAYDTPSDHITVVDSIVIRFVSSLSIEYVSFALFDGGNPSNLSGGRVGEVLNYSIGPPIDGSGVLPVGYQVGGGTTLRLVARNLDPVAPHALEVELRGRLFPAAQFRNGR